MARRKMKPEAMLRGVIGALRSKKTPKQFLPSLRKRKAALERKLR